MTVGIAAVCDWGRHIVLASDQMISTEESSGDGVAIKIWSIHRDWGCVYAGNDLAHVSPIYSRAREILSQAHPASRENVTQAMILAYRREFREAVDAYLSPFDLNLDTFKEKGLAIFGPVMFASHCEHVADLDLECEFLVAGFDQQQRTAHVFEVVNPGEAVNQDTCGFSAIGSGAVVATNSLLFHSYNNRMGLIHAIYHVCEAKFMTERPGIGETTSAVVLNRDGEGDTTFSSDLSDDFIADIRKAWKTKGQQRFAPSAEGLIANGMKDPGRFRRVIFG